MDAPTIANTISLFLIDRRARGLSSNSIRFYRDELGLFCRYLEGQRITGMDQLEADTIRGYLTALQEKRNTGGIHVAYRSIRVFLRWWERETDGEFANPIGKVDVKAPRSVALPGVEMADIQRLIDACSSEMAQRDKTILLTLLDTGARAFEFVALNLGDIDLATGAVKIQRGKGNKERTVYVGNRTRREIRKLLKNRTHLNPADPIWLTDEGTRLTKRGLYAIVERRAADAHIRVPGLHDFRRAFAVNMWRNGVDLLTISRLMGHADLETTKRYIKDNDMDLRNGHAKGGPVDHAGL